MNCTTCTREMKAHYSSMYCPWCTCDISKLTLFSGYIAYRDNGMHSPLHVFKNVSSAKKWKSVHEWDDATITKVLSPKPFKWCESRGALTGEQVAQRLFFLTEDHKFDSKESFIFLAPQNYRPPATPMPPSETEEDTRSEGDRLVDFFASSTNR